MSLVSRIVALVPRSKLGRRELASGGEGDPRSSPDFTESDFVAKSASNNWPGEPFAVGQRVEQYLILSQLGEGRFGRVWKVYDVQSERDFALKEFLSEAHTGESRVKAAIYFCRGVAAMRRLSGSQYIVRTVSGPHATRGRLWFVMDHYPDRSLDHWIDRLEDAEMHRFCGDLIAGVTFAHSNGVRHRDIRPANILIDSAPTPDAARRAVLSDFDIAYYENFSTLTTTTLFANQSRYVWPHVSGANDTDAIARLRSRENDLYALCVVIFDLFAGANTTIPSASRREDLERRITDAIVVHREHVQFRQKTAARRVARFLSYGLGRSTELNYKTIEQLAARWHIAVEVQPLAAAESAILLCVVFTGLSIATIVDYAIFGQEAAHTINSDIALGSWGVAISALAPATTYILARSSSSLTATRDAFVSWIASRMRVLIGLPVLGMFALLISATLCSLPDRWQSVQVYRGRDCFLGVGEGLRAITNEKETVRVRADTHGLYCPDGSSAAVVPLNAFAHLALHELKESGAVAPSASVQAAPSAPPTFSASAQSWTVAAQSSSIFRGHRARLTLVSLECSILQNGDSDEPFLRMRSAELFTRSYNVSDEGPFICSPEHPKLFLRKELFELPSLSRSVRVTIEVRERDNRDSDYLGRVLFDFSPADEGWEVTGRAEDGALITRHEWTWTARVQREGADYLLVFDLGANE